jgi:hypothetical protein
MLTREKKKPTFPHPAACQPVSAQVTLIDSVTYINWLETRGRFIGSCVMQQERIRGWQLQVEQRRLTVTLLHHSRGSADDSASGRAKTDIMGKLKLKGPASQAREQGFSQRLKLRPSCMWWDLPGSVIRTK